MRNKTITSWLMMAAMIAVLLRALVPVGYMPNFSGDNAFQLVICTAQGAESIPADDAYNPFHKSSAPVKSHEVAKPCDFSLNAVNAIHIAGPDFVLVTLVMAAAFVKSRREFALTRQRYYSPSSPRAPPLFV